MHHRGPDDGGVYAGEGVGLGHRRLAILDLSERGRQPMASKDGRYWITYNGEIYNYRELREELETGGQTFYSDTDTEVLLALFAAQGAAMLPRLNGMFAFAVWDCGQRKLFVARDRLGVKPLYYAMPDGAGFWFASEEKALFAAGLPRVFDADTLEELLCFRHVAGEKTPFAGILRLRPGHYLEWQAGKATVCRWWNLQERARELGPIHDPVAWFRGTFDDAVRLRRISDVPLGVLLSGGLDSGSVAAALAAQAGNGVQSFTVRFEDPGFDEGPLAREVASRWGLIPHEWKASDGGLLESLAEASRLNDEPLAHGNDLHLLTISQVAKPLVTVLLSGEGADETLGGYVRYQPLRYPTTLMALRPLLGAATALGVSLSGRMRKLAAFLSLGDAENFVLFNSCNTLPGDLEALGMAVRSEFSFRRRILEEARWFHPREPVRQALYYDQHTFLCSILDRNDRMTMGASIECRVPFLDYRLVEGTSRLPSAALFHGRRTKALLREALGDRLPASVLEHRKWGFGVPWPRLLREVAPLRSWVESLPRRFPAADGPFLRGAVEGVVRAFLAGEEDNGPLVQQLTSLSIWHQAVFGKDS